MPMRTTWRPGREGPTLYAYPASAPAQDAAPDATAEAAPPNSAIDPVPWGGTEPSEVSPRPAEATNRISDECKSVIGKDGLDPALMFCLQDRARFRMAILRSSDG